MHGNVPFGVASATEIERRKQTCPDEIVSRKIGPVCKVLWPFKTAAHVGSIIGASERHAARILAGEFEAPAKLIAAVVAEIAK